MVDLSHEMADLISAFGPGPADRARVIGFVSALSGEGTSLISQEFARVAALSSPKPAWLVNVDLVHPQLTLDQGFFHRFGHPGQEGRGSPDGTAFFTLSPPMAGPDGQAQLDGDYLKARAFLNGRLWISRVQTERLSPRQRIGLRADGAYFNSLRPHASYVVVDMPAADRSQAGLLLGAQCDGVVLVVAEGAGDARYVAGLKRLMIANGVNLLGLVYNHPPRGNGGPRDAPSPPSHGPASPMPFGQAPVR